MNLQPTPYSPFSFVGREGGRQRPPCCLSVSRPGRADSLISPPHKQTVAHLPPPPLPAALPTRRHRHNIRHIADRNCQSAATRRSLRNDNRLILHLLAPRRRQPPSVTCRAAPAAATTVPSRRGCRGVRPVAGGVIFFQP